MTQVRSRRDGNRPFFREGLSVTSQFGALFFFSVDQLGTEISEPSRFALRLSDFRPGKAKYHRTHSIGTTPLKSQSQYFINTQGIDSGEVH